MARITDEWIQREFYKRFFRSTLPEQDGIIRGLEAVRDCKASDTSEPQPAAVLAQSDEADAPLLNEINGAGDPAPNQ